MVHSSYSFDCLRLSLQGVRSGATLLPHPTHQMVGLARSTIRVQGEAVNHRVQRLFTLRKIGSRDPAIDVVEPIGSRHCGVDYGSIHTFELRFDGVLECRVVAKVDSLWANNRLDLGKLGEASNPEIGILLW